MSIIIERPRQWLGKPSRASHALACCALALLLPQVATACSGPGAMASILRAELMGWQLLGATAAVALLSALLLHRWKVASYRVSLVAVPLLVHPGWWLSARGGDCGRMRVFGSIGVTAIAAVVLALALLVTALRRRT